MKGIPLTSLCDSSSIGPGTNKHHHILMLPSDDDDDDMLLTIVKGSWDIPLRNPASFLCPDCLERG